MKKSFTSLKSFALASAFLLAGSASAQITSIPYSQDFEDGTTAPFVGAEGVAVVNGNESTTKVFGVVGGEAIAEFAIDGGAYNLANGEEVTVGFQMFNGWLGNGKDNKIAILNSEGYELASISYNENNCTISDISIGGATAAKFAAFTGQSCRDAGTGGANGFDKNIYQGSETANPLVTIKLKDNGEASVGVVFAQRSIDVEYTGTIEGAKMDLAKIVFTSPNGNANRATYIDNLSITTREYGDKTIGSISFDDDANPVITKAGYNGGRGNAEYYKSVVGEGNYLSVWGENNTNDTFSFPVTEEDVTTYGQWTLSFDFAGYGGCNKKAGSTQVLDAEGNVLFSIDDVADWNNTMNLSCGGTVASYPCNKDNRGSNAASSAVLTSQYWSHITLTGSKNGIFVTVQPYDAEGNLLEATVANKKAYASNAIPASMSVTPGSFSVHALDNLNLTVGDLKIVAFDYTVLFVTEDGEEIKPAETRNDVQGTELAITEEDKATITEGKTQYIYVTDDAGSTLDGEGQTISIVFHKLSVADYVVNFVDADGNAIKDAATHKNAEVGTEVSATSAETSTILVENTLYQYVSGNDAITVAEDESANVITLVFAPIEGVTAYYFENYETGTTANWKVAAGGRYDPISVNGSTIPSRIEDVMEEQEVEVTDSLGNVTTVTQSVKVDEKEVPFGNASKFLSVTQANRNNNGTTLTGSDISVDVADFTLEAKLLIGSSNDQTGTNLQIMNQANTTAILKLQQKAEKSTSDWSINGEAEYVTFPRSGTYTGTDNNNLNNYNWYSVKVTVYKGMTFLTIPELGIEQKQIPTLAETYGVGNIVFATSRYNANFAIDDIVIRSVSESDIPAGLETAKVTFNYVDEEGQAVKEADVVEFAAGEAVEIRDMYKESFKVYEEGSEVPTAKYIYVSDNSAEVTAIEGAQVNITFRKAETGRLVLRYKTMIDGVATNTNVALLDTKATGDVLFEGDEIMVYSPLYVWINGADGKGDIPMLFNGFKQAYEFRESYTVPALKTTGSTVVYPDFATVSPANTVETDSLENVLSEIVFFAETEDLAGITVVNDTYTQIRMSNGKAGSAAEGDVLVTTLQPGQYTITSSTRSGLTNFTINGSVVYSIESGGAISTSTSDVLNIKEEVGLYIQQQTKLSDYNDYVLIKKVGEYDENTPATEITSATATAVPSIAKMIENGKIVILKGGKKYTVTGVQVK